MVSFDNVNSIWIFSTATAGAGANSSRLTVAVMGLVVLQRGRVGKRLRTAVTVEWFLCGVRGQMVFESVERHECLVAQLALIWSLAGVCAHVDPQTVVHAEPAVAYFAAVRPFTRVRTHVLPQRVGQPEGLATHLTLVRLPARVQQLVGPEGATVPCLERTQRAGVLWLLDSQDALPGTVRVLLGYVHGPEA